MCSYNSKENKMASSGKCVACNGTGKGGVSDNSKKDYCPVCNGTGRCNFCAGKGTIAGKDCSNCAR